MLIRITQLKAGEYFKHNGVIYQKVKKYEHSNECLNTETGKIEGYPLMMFVETAEAPKPKSSIKKSGPVHVIIKKDLNEPQPESDSI